MNLAAQRIISDVQIWQVDTNDLGWDRFADVLNLEERKKSERFHTSILQIRYRRCRSALRVLLAGYVGQDAGELVFSYGECGKPELVKQPLHFNLSHSGTTALIAISAYPIGIDLEQIVKHRVGSELVELVCHPHEITALNLLLGEELQAAFYNIWTQKEAYCKALGVGLHKPLPAVYFQPVTSPHVCQVCDEKPIDHSIYFVYILPIVDGYSVSVCVPLPHAHICLGKALPGMLSSFSTNFPFANNSITNVSGFILPREFPCKS